MERVRNKVTTVAITPDFYNLAKANHIRFSEAVAVGISIMLAEKGVTKYDNSLNRFRKVSFLVDMQSKIQLMLDSEMTKLTEVKEDAPK